jgi:hypothetical protein
VVIGLGTEAPFRTCHFAFFAACLTLCPVLTQQPKTRVVSWIFLEKHWPSILRRTNGAGQLQT